MISLSHSLEFRDNLRVSPAVFFLWHTVLWNFSQILDKEYTCSLIAFPLWHITKPSMYFVPSGFFQPTDLFCLIFFFMNIINIIWCHSRIYYSVAVSFLRKHCILFTSLLAKRTNSSVLLLSKHSKYKTFYLCLCLEWSFEIKYSGFTKSFSALTYFQTIHQSIYSEVWLKRSRKKKKSILLYKHHITFKSD